MIKISFCHNDITHAIAVFISTAMIGIVAFSAIALWAFGSVNVTMLFFLIFFMAVIVSQLEPPLFKRHTNILFGKAAPRALGIDGVDGNSLDARFCGNVESGGCAGIFADKNVICHSSLDRSTRWVLLLAVLVGVFLYGRQFPYESIWGDIGVYVNAASFFRNGGSIPFDWVALVWDFDRNAPIAPPRGMINPAHVEGFQFHGLPTWPVLMAASGLGNDGREILAPLYAICIFLFYFNAYRIIKDRVAALLAAVLFAVLPLLWHQALYPTTEMLVLGIFLSGLTLATCVNGGKWLIGVSVFSFGVVHSSFLILVPVIGCVIGFIGLRGGNLHKRRVAITSMGVSLGALLALAFGYMNSAAYMQDIVRGLFGEHGYLAAILCLMPLMGVVPWLVGERLSAGRGFRVLHGAFLRGFPLAASVVLLGMITVVAGKAYYLGWTTYYIPDASNEFSSWSARVAYANKGLSSLSHLSVVNIFLASAGLGVVAWLAFTLSHPRSLRLKLLWWFTCAFLIVFGVMRIDIPNNFYASRYFVPVLVPCLMFFAAWLFSVRKWTRLALIPVLLWAAHVNAATIGARFFSTDAELVSFLERHLSKQDLFVFSGSDWLRYHIVSRTINLHPLTAGDGKSKNEIPNFKGPVRLITDSTRVVVGEQDCVEFVERRIPWQISYWSSAQLVKRQVCAYTVRGGEPVTASLGGNSWAMNGVFDFMVFAPVLAEKVKITFHSNGWWASKKPFLSDKTSLNPKLTVCGVNFALVQLDARQIVFEGLVRDPVCGAQLATSTFVPAQIGEGTDNRSLGVDLHAIEVSTVGRN